jgi:hypothetical protein
LECELTDLFVVPVQGPGRSVSWLLLELPLELGEFEVASHVMCFSERRRKGDSRGNDI